MSKRAYCAHILVYVSLMSFSAGCTTVSTDAEGSPILGGWIGAQPRNHSLVVDVLRDHGLHPTLDERRGVIIREDEQAEAYRVLLTDHRMQEANLMLFAMVRAGTGRNTDDGVLAPVLGAWTDPQSPCDASMP